MHNVGIPYFPEINNTYFKVKNIAPGNKKIRIFTYPINNGEIRDLLAIPGISEADIRHSLLKGELFIKLTNNEIIITESNVDLLQFSSEHKSFLQSKGVILGLEVAATGSGGESSLSEEQHSQLRSLIHFIDDGPASGFATDAYKEILPSGDAFPTQMIWWESDNKLQKIVELLVTRDDDQKPVTERWNMYDEGGIAVLSSIIDTINYTGSFETSRNRQIITYNDGEVVEIPSEDGYLEEGAIVYYDGYSWVPLAPGESGKYLQSNGNDAPSWEEVVGSGSSFTSSIIEGTDLISTTSLNEVLIPNMTTIPSAGTYVIILNCDLQQSTSLESISISLYFNSVKLTERTVVQQSANDTVSITCLAKVICDGTNSLEGRWKVSGGTGFISNRSITLLQTSNSEIAEETSQTSTTSTTDVLSDEMTLDLATGKYLIFFNGNVSNSINNESVYTDIYSGGSKLSSSERRMVSVNSEINNFHCVAYVNLSATTTVEGKWRVSAGTATMYNRALYAIEVN